MLFSFCEKMQTFSKNEVLFLKMIGMECHVPCGAGEIRGTQYLIASSPSNSFVSDSYQTTNPLLSTTGANSTTEKR
jgi:hypothetical protein